MKTVYTVTQAMPGYLPQDDSPFQTTNRRTAESAAAAMAHELREDGYRTWGNAKDGSIYCSSGNGPDLTIEIYPMSYEQFISDGGSDSDLN